MERKHSPECFRLVTAFNVDAQVGPIIWWRRAETVDEILSSLANILKGFQAQGTSGNLSSCIHSMPSDLNNGTAENLSLLQRNAGLLDLFQGISVSH